jgi:transcription initiation factor TFIID subunit TAF12
MDPPYQDPPEIILSFLKRAASTGLATTGATAVWEQATQTLKLWEPPDPWLLISTRNLGERAAAILELAEEEEDKEEEDSAGEDGHNEV